MEVTKCDRCGCYVDKSSVNMPMVIYAYSEGDYTRGNRVRKNICYNCYAELKKWLNNEEDVMSRKAVFEAIDDCNSDGLTGIFCSYDDGERFKEYINKKLPPVETIIEAYKGQK